MNKMEETKPISPKDEAIIDKDYELNVAIDYINTKIKNKEWHDQIFPVEGYEAIILSPYGKYINVMDRVVEKFKAEGWDCKWSSAYDARGPHYCFYVSAGHF
jgi:hypothetical protein